MRWRERPALVVCQSGALTGCAWGGVIGRTWQLESVSRLPEVNQSYVGQGSFWLKIHHHSDSRNSNQEDVFRLMMLRRERESIVNTDHYGHGYEPRMTSNAGLSTLQPRADFVSIQGYGRCVRDCVARKDSSFRIVRCAHSFPQHRLLFSYLGIELVKGIDEQSCPQVGFQGRGFTGISHDIVDCCGPFLWPKIQRTYGQAVHRQGDPRSFRDLQLLLHDRQLPTCGYGLFVCGLNQRPELLNLIGRVSSLSSSIRCQGMSFVNESFGLRRGCREGAPLSSSVDRISDCSCCCNNGGEGYYMISVRQKQPSPESATSVSHPLKGTILLLVGVVIVAIAWRFLVDGWRGVLPGVCIFLVAIWVIYHAMNLGSYPKSVTSVRRAAAAGHSSGRWLQ